MRKLIFTILACLAICAPDAYAEEMTVSAAASLTNAFTEMAEAFEKSHPGLTVHTNFAASNPLLKQIVEGAPVDVFASADQATMDKAVTAQVVKPETRTDFAVNDLVLIVPKGHKKPANLEELQKMANIAIGNPDSVPAGRYTKSTLEHAGLWNKLENKFIMGSSVRQTLDYVARGEVDAGFVYATDARQQAGKVDVALVAEGHDPVTYPIAVAVAGNNAKAGEEFLQFVLSPEGQAILAKYGFAKP